MVNSPEAGRPDAGRRRAGRALTLLPLLSLGACSHAQIPYPLEQLPPARRALHPLRVAVLPLEDAREPAEVEAEDGLFSYGGLDYEPTELDALAAPPGVVLAELLARHLVRAGSFREVVLVRAPSDAPEAALLLRGRIRRARGYVEAAGQRPGPPPPAPTRRVIAEVFLSDVELVEPGPEGRRRLHADLGWSILEDRPAEPAPPSAWQVLGEALFESHQQLARLLEEAVLDGSFVVQDQAHLQPARARSSSVASPLRALPARAPPGWEFRLDPDPSAPLGWRSSGTCEGGRYQARQTQRFHRVLGPYRPSVRVWLCPAALPLELDHGVEFPAIYLGTTPSAEHAFLWRLGPSSWPSAERELQAELEVSAPAQRYLFRINGGTSGPRLDRP